MPALIEFSVTALRLVPPPTGSLPFVFFIIANGRRLLHPCFLGIAFSAAGVIYFEHIFDDNDFRQAQHLCIPKTGLAPMNGINAATTQKKC